MFLRQALFVTGFLLLLSCGRSRQTIKIKGSDTEVNLVVRLAEAFQEVNPDFYVSISGGGSGLGIASLLNGQADIANSSRPINSGELDLFRKRDIVLDSFVFAEDALAIVVRRDFPLDTITVETLAAILSGKLANWKPLTGKDLPINIYGRQSNSGTHAFLQNKLNIHFTPRAREMNGNAQIIEAIKSDASGVGYVGAGYVMAGANNAQHPLKVLRLSPGPGERAVSPLDVKAIAEGRYFLQRPLYQYMPASSVHKVQAFIDFEKSTRGVEIIRASGYYPISLLQQQARR